MLALGESVCFSELGTFKGPRVGGRPISGPEIEFWEEFQGSVDVFRIETVSTLCYIGLSLCPWVCEHPCGVVGKVKLEGGNI